MHRTKTVRLAAIALLLPTAIALGGCKAKAPTTSSSSSSSSASSSSSTSSSGSATGSSASGSCAAGYVTGQIAGQQKCLQNGQQCQAQAAGDYKKYGFTCTKGTDGRYLLKKS